MNMQGCKEKKSSIGETFILFLPNLISIFIHHYGCHTVFTDIKDIPPPHGKK